MTPEEEKKFDLCYEKTKNLPRGTAEERGKASLATLKCMDDKSMLSKVIVLLSW